MSDRQQMIEFQIRYLEERLTDEQAAFEKRQFETKQRVSDLKAQLHDIRKALA